MIDLNALEKSYRHCPNFGEGTLLDASDFACLEKLELPVLNGLIQQVSHELYQPEANAYEARASVVSLINLGLLSRSHIYNSPQYA